MNKTILIGRLTKDIELKRTNSDLPYCNFNLAVKRAYKSQSGEQQTDFINCVAWRKTAEVLSQYVFKGHQVGIEGSIQTRTYDDKNGRKQYVTEVLVEQVHFLEPKNSNNNQQQYQQPQYQNGYGQNNTYQRPQNQMPNQQEQKNENPFADVDFEISSDGLPF